MNITLRDVILGAIASLAAVSVVQAQTFPASQVGNISLSGRNLSSPYLTVNWWDSEKNVGLVQFELSSLGTNSVSSATLNLYHLYNNGNGAVFGIFENTSAWNSGISSWSDLPTHLAAPTAVIAINDVDVNVWRTANVTSAVNSWTSGTSTNYGFTIERVDQDNPFVYFTAGPSFDGFSFGFTPTLTVGAVPEPETSAMLMVSLGVLGLVIRRRKQGA